MIRFVAKREKSVLLFFKLATVGCTNSFFVGDKINYCIGHAMKYCLQIKNIFSEERECMNLKILTNVRTKSMST